MRLLFAGFGSAAFLIADAEGRVEVAIFNPGIYNKPSRLDRGLAALIGDVATAEGVRGTDTSSGVRRVTIGQLVANHANPRLDFDADQLVARGSV